MRSVSKEDGAIHETLQRIEARLDGLDEAVSTIQSDIAAGKQYEKSHDQLHRNMAKAAGDEINRLHKALAEVMQALVKKQDINVTVPQSKVQVQLNDTDSVIDFDLKRDQQGRLSGGQMRKHK